ncbi:hypothetical protein [Microbacterium indicum]|uniref:hypothetical protein n=1 Tax=Microbacterium indicum TaxID=358100 RepID=UPI00040CFC15|nr:hypothetical protein [Microbacterium indicum]
MTKPPRRRALRIAIAALVAVVLVAGIGLGVAAKEILFPRYDRVQHVDAIIVLGPVSDWRMEQAEDLLDAGVADEIAYSIVDSYHPPSYCADIHVDAMCFHPEPFTTQGEATWARDEAEERGWDSIAVVTLDQHSERARHIFEGCLGDGVDIEMVDPTEQPPLGFARAWDGFWYQVGAWGKALFVTPGCA